MELFIGFMFGISFMCMIGGLLWDILERRNNPGELHDIFEKAKKDMDKAVKRG